MAELGTPSALSRAPRGPGAPRAPEPRRGGPSRGFCALLGVLTVGLAGCDHATKLAAEAALAGRGAVAVAPGLLELRYARNDDTAFSLLRTFGIAREPGVLLAVSAVALVAMGAAWFAARRRATAAQHVGFALVLAGALGNVVDRAARGYVVDFIHVTRWPVFNVADVAVVAGVALLLLAGLRRSAVPDARG